MQMLAAEAALRRLSWGHGWEGPCPVVGALQRGWTCVVLLRGTGAAAGAAGLGSQEAMPVPVLPALLVLMTCRRRHPAALAAACSAGPRSAG